MSRRERWESLITSSTRLSQSGLDCGCHGCRRLILLLEHLEKLVLLGRSLATSLSSTGTPFTRSSISLSCRRAEAICSLTVWSWAGGIWAEAAAGVLLPEV